MMYKLFMDIMKVAHLALFMPWVVHKQEPMLCIGNQGWLNSMSAHKPSFPILSFFLATSCVPAPGSSNLADPSAQPCI